MAISMNYVIGGIIALVVIFTVAIVFTTYAPESLGQVGTIAEEVFSSGSVGKETAKDSTLKSYESFKASASACNTDCLCSDWSGKIAQDYRIHFKNEDEETLITVIDEEQVYLAQETRGLKVGLFVVYNIGEQRTLRCVIPDSFELKGVGTNWFVEWDDSRTIGQQFAVEMSEGDVALYKASADSYCIMTSLAFDDLDSKASDQLVPELNYPVRSIEGNIFTGSSLDLESLKDFYKEKACPV